MSGNGSNVLTGVNIPQTDGCIPTPTGKDVTLRIKGDSVGISRVLGKGFDGFTRNSIPQANGIVLAPRLPIYPHPKKRRHRR